MDILNLPGWKIISVNESEHDYLMEVEYEAERVICPKCAVINEYSRFGKLEQLVMDLPVHAKRVGLNIQRQRYQCKACSRTFMQHLPDIDEKRAATRRLIDYIRKQSLIRTFTSIADDVGVDEKTVRNIFREHLNDLQETIEFETPEIMGIDELTLMKKPRCIITNIRDRTVVELLETRNKPAVVEYLRNMPDRQRVRLVAMDMWNPYKEAVRSVMPRVPIVVDKFHIVRMANASLEDVRKAVRRSLTDRQRRQLMHDRFILLRRRAELNEKDELRMQAWLGAFPELAAAYDLKERFFGIWDATNATDAGVLYADWAESIPDELGEYFQPITTAVNNWQDEIFAYWQYGRITNAYTEAVNGLAKLTNKIGRGYSFEAIRAKLLFGNGLKKQAKPKYGSSEFRSIGYALPFSLSSVERQRFTSKGNEISTLTRHLEDEAN